MNTPTVDRMKGLVDSAQGLLNRQIFFSQEIYQQELERIFARSWLYLGHVSQFPIRTISSLLTWGKIRSCCAGALTAGYGLS